MKNVVWNVLDKFEYSWKILNARKHSKNMQNIEDIQLLHNLYKTIYLQQILVFSFQFQLFLQIWAKLQCFKLNHVSPRVNNIL